MRPPRLSPVRLPVAGGGGRRRRRGSGGAGAGGTRDRSARVDAPASLHGSHASPRAGGARRPSWRPSIRPRGVTGRIRGPRSARPWPRTSPSCASSWSARFRRTRWAAAVRSRRGSCCWPRRRACRCACSSSARAPGSTCAGTRSATARPDSPSAIRRHRWTSATSSKGRRRARPTASRWSSGPDAIPGRWTRPARTACSRSAPTSGRTSSSDSASSTAPLRWPREFRSSWSGRAGRSGSSGGWRSRWRARARSSSTRSSCSTWSRTSATGSAS